MKKKLLSLAMAGLMIVICLTGCSNALSSDSICQTAKKFGMAEAGDYSEFEAELQHAFSIGAILYDDYSAPGNCSVYYDFTSSEEVEEWYRANHNIGDNHYPDIRLKDGVVCIDHKTVEKDGYDAVTYINMITTVDRKSANELYAECCSNYEPMTKITSSGKQNGYSYTIGYGDYLTGIYQQGNNVFIFWSIGDDVPENNCCDFFCKDLGLVSPSTLKK